MSDKSALEVSGLDDGRRQMGLLRPGETCWRSDRARRATFLVDYQDYFAALGSALAQAKRTIHILGWGFDPRTRLAPDGSPRADAPDQIGATLIRLAEANSDLDVRVLVWRSALPISASQSFFPHRAKAWFQGSQVKFELDATVPFGACHHQKAVVIDDALAFLGSGDLTGDRWDTPAHLDADGRRESPWGRQHAPRHEVTVMAEGGVAADLGVLFRHRWRLATGEALTSPEPITASPWPREIAPDLEDAPVGVARTLPGWREQAEVTEISRLTLEAIGAAQSLIYIENQYFAWPAAAEAIAARLAEPEGPEVVVILSARSPSYFDRLTMDVTRQLILWRMQAADVFGRLHVLAPATTAGRPIICHAKVMIVDDVLARISSANLNNRSQGFDTECELAFEAAGPSHSQALAAFRDCLAGHWVGRAGADVARERGRHGGLAAALTALDRRGRLRRLEPGPLSPLGELIAVFHLGDPAGPSDSWRPWRRTRRLVDQIRAVKAVALTPPDGSPPPAADGQRPRETADRAAS